MENKLLIEVEKKIITVRNKKVILDSDVAELYDVLTKEINQGVRNNPRKFPEGYVFELTEDEKNEVVKNFDHLQKLKFSPQLPKAFTEKGLYMLATILKSDQAVDTTIAIVEAYAKLKELSRIIVEVPQQKNNSTTQQFLLQRGGQLVEEIMSDVLPKQSSETSFELNLAMFKFKHSVKRENDDEIKQLKEKLARLEKKIKPWCRIIAVCLNKKRPDIAGRWTLVKNANEKINLSMAGYSHTFKTLLLDDVQPWVSVAWTETILLLFDGITRTVPNEPGDWYSHKYAFQI